MEKPILATALKGLFIKSSPWIDAHLIWYEDREKEIKKQGLDETAIKEWRALLKSDPEKERKEYFKFVDKVMKVFYPNLSDEKRTEKARESYFDSTIKYIKQNPDTVNKEIINYFKSLKDKYRLALITTNTPQALKSILKVSKLENLFDIIEASSPKEKDDKKVVFDRFIEKNDKPKLYIGNSKEALLYSKEKEINTLYANLERDEEIKVERDEEIKEVQSVNNLKKLKEKIENLQK